MALEWKIVEGALLIRQKDWCGQQVWTRVHADEAATIIEAERKAIIKIVDEHAASGRSFGVDAVCDQIIAAINARSEREG
jgi:hypothetical protein